MRETEGERGEERERSGWKEGRNERSDKMKVSGVLNNVIQILRCLETG